MRQMHGSIQDLILTASQSLHSFSPAQTKSRTTNHLTVNFEHSFIRSTQLASMAPSLRVLMSSSCTTLSRRFITPGPIQVKKQTPPFYKPLTNIGRTWHSRDR